MILQKYLSKEVLQTSLVVMLFLMMMTLGNWLIIAFGWVVRGRIKYEMIIELMVYQIPQLLEFILPLGVFIGIMLTLSRQYVEQEVTIVKTSGYSAQKYARLLFPLLMVYFILQCFIIIYAKPAGLFSAEKMKAENAVKNAFDLVKPKEFVTFNQYSLYVGGVSEDKLALKDVVLIEKNGATNGRDRVILASLAKQVIPNDLNLQKNKVHNKVTQLDLFQGSQYEIGANNKQYNHTSFENYRLSIRIPQKNKPKEIALEAQSSLSLLNRIHENDAKAEMAYRITSPFIIWLAIVLALPLSHVSPRKGRWVRLVPSILLYATSVLIMGAIKGSISKGKIPVVVLPLILVLYFMFGVYLYQKEDIHRSIKRFFSQGSSTNNNGNIGGSKG